MMNKMTNSRFFWPAVAGAVLLLSAGCGGGNKDIAATEGSDARFSTANSSFDYKSVQSVRFADVITQMKNTVTLPASVSGTNAFVSIYVGSSDSRNQLALLTVDLYRSLVNGSSSTETLGIEIPLGTTAVHYEFFGEDNASNPVSLSGSVNL